MGKIEIISEKLGIRLSAEGWVAVVVVFAIALVVVSFFVGL